MRAPLVAIVLLVSCAATRVPATSAPHGYCSPTHVDAYVRLVRDGSRAFRRKDYAAAGASFERALAENPGEDQLMYRLARMHDKKGDPEGAIAWLHRLADSGSDMVPTAEQFPDLAARNDFAAIVATTERHAIRRASPYLEGDEPGLIPEGIAFDPVDGRFFVGSMRRRKIVAMIPGRAAVDFVPERENGLDAVCGLRVDRAHGLLWAATAMAKEQDNYRAEDDGRTALVAFELGSGREVARYEPPRGAQGFFNDVAVDAGGNAFVTDSAAGAVWVVRRGDRQPTLLVPPKTLDYPNGIAVDAHTGALFVVDTPTGIYRVDPRSGEVRPLATPQGLSLLTIDGLYAEGGNLVAIELGGRRGRVVEFALDSAERCVTGRKVLESGNPSFDVPTTAAVTDDAVYVLANSQQESTSPPAAIVVLRIPRSTSSR